MKLLFDENLPRHLARRLASTFPDCAHVTGVGLERATDREVWQYAREHDFTLVSKDSDFNDLAFIHGPPPKVIWLRIGNASTDEVEELLACRHRSRRRAPRWRRPRRLFPQGDRYLVPIRAAVRRAEEPTLGDHVTVLLRLDA